MKKQELFLYLKTIGILIVLSILAGILSYVLYSLINMATGINLQPNFMPEAFYSPYLLSCVIQTALNAAITFFMAKYFYGASKSLNQSKVTNVFVAIMVIFQLASLLIITVYTYMNNAVMFSNPNYVFQNVLMLVNLGLSVYIFKNVVSNRGKFKR